MNVATFESCFEIDSQGNSSTRVSNEPRADCGVSGVGQSLGSVGILVESIY